MPTSKVINDDSLKFPRWVRQYEWGGLWLKGLYNGLGLLDGR